MVDKLEHAFRDVLTYLAIALAHLVIWIALPRDLAIGFSAVIFAAEGLTGFLGRLQLADGSATRYMMNMDAHALRKGVQSYFDAGREGQAYVHDWNAEDGVYHGIEKAKQELQGDRGSRMTGAVFSFLASIAVVIAMAALGSWLKPTVAPMVGL